MTFVEEKAGHDPGLKDGENSLNGDSSLSSFQFSLSSQLGANLERKGLTLPTEVQLEVIPKIRNGAGGDLCVNAPTGSGKTLAYAVPITEVQIIHARR
jgi:superfamily II DNA/RNA helicase